MGLVTLKWPGFILPSHKITFLVPQKQVYPHSKREAECGTPLFEPFCRPPVALLLPPLLGAEVGRETPQLRHAQLGVEVQVCPYSSCACRVLFTLLHIAFFQIIHHQYQGMLQNKLSPSLKGKQTYPYRAHTSKMHMCTQTSTE